MANGTRAAWRAIAWLLVALGCFVSFVVSGRLTARLVLDGAISFAFIPIVEVCGFAAAMSLRTSRSPIRFRDALGPFLAGNTPWLLWLTATGAAWTLLPPRQVTQATLFLTALTALVPFIWSAATDFQFFQDVTHRTRRDAWIDLAVTRGVAWTMGILYFFGIALWSLAQPSWARWLS